MSFGYWIKLYHDILDSPKVGMLPDSAKWRFVACLVVAGEAGDDGFLPELEALAWRLRLSPTELEGDLVLMARRGLVELRRHKDGDERWFMTNFAERQAKMTPAERVKRHRKSARNANVTKRYTEAEAEAEAEADIEADAEQIQKQKQKKHAHPRVAAAAAAPAIASESNDIQADPDDNPTALVLRTHGIALNQTTARLLDEPAEFVEGHLLAAQRRGETTGLAIRRIIDGDPVPRKPGDPVRQYIPAELADIINR